MREVVVAVVVVIVPEIVDVMIVEVMRAFDDVLLTLIEAIGSIDGVIDVEDVWLLQLVSSVEVEYVD